MRDYLIISGTAAAILDTLINLLNNQSHCPVAGGGNMNNEVSTDSSLDFFDMEMGGQESSPHTEALVYCPDLFSSSRLAVSFMALLGTLALSALVTNIHVSYQSYN